MIKRLISSLVLKSMGLPSIQDYKSEAINDLFARNDISEEKLTEYRVDRSSYQPQFFEITMVGTCLYKSRLTGIIVGYDESTGRKWGNLVSKEHVGFHRIFYTKYISGELYSSSLYSAFLFEMDGCDSEKMAPRHELI